RLGEKNFSRCPFLARPPVAAIDAAPRRSARHSNSIIARTAPLLEHVRLCLKHFGAAHSVRSPPPCGEGLGVGVRQRITARPPPRRHSASKTRVNALEAPTLPQPAAGLPASGKS